MASMPTSNKLGKAGGWLILSIFGMGFALFSDGMADGKVSSLSGFWSDLIGLDPGILLRIVWWLMVLLPVAILGVMLMEWRKHREQRRDH